MLHASRPDGHPFDTLAILGGGAWGTVLALLAHQAGRSVRLWARDPLHAAELRRARENRAHLPGVPLPEAVDVTSDLSDAVEGADLVTLAVPSSGFRDVMVALTHRSGGRTPVLIGSKGIAPGAFRLLGQVVSEVAPQTPFAVLSGPNLASEIALGKPTAATVASSDASLARAVQSSFAQGRFRVYTSPDIVGVQVGAALKNVIALAAGMSDGLELGDNAKATIITRGLAELVRLGTTLGGDARTFYGLAGLGDLVATCGSSRSRNHTAGRRVAQGATLADLQRSRITAEGIPTALAVHRLLRAGGLVSGPHGAPLRLPISEEVYRVVYEAAAPADAIERLMGREPRAE